MRVMVLGASETFGIYESDQKEFPAQVAGLLRAKGGSPKVEVINAAIVGMTVRSMIPYWRNWASQFRPKIVVVYPSPLFYLEGEVRTVAPQKYISNFESSVPSLDSFTCRFLGCIRG